MSASHHSLVACALALMATAAGDAAADDFQVEPTRLDLVRRGAPSQLTITNRGRVAARFQAKAFVWGADDQGVMQLSPAPDVVVYPTLFALAPGSKRAIRVATTTEPGVKERSYRIFIEELPPPRDARKPAAVTVITRIGVPIFVAPTKPVVQGDVTGSIADGTARLFINNRGTVHVKVGAVHLIARNRAGGVVFDRPLASWYLLAGGTRTYSVGLAPTCKAIDQLAIEATTDRGTWRTTIAMPAYGCRGRQ